MRESGSMAGNTPGLKRFKLAVQKNRMIFFVFCFVITSFFRPMGIWQVDPVEGGMVAGAGALSALLFYLLYQKHWERNLDPIWLILDAFLVGFGVIVSGGVNSPIYLWYAANLAAAAFMGGMLWVVILAALDVVLYLGTLMVTGSIRWLEPGFFQALTQIGFLFLACSFIFLGVSTLQQKRRLIRQLKEEESRKVEELTRLTGILEARTEELAEANRRIQQADQAKSQFLANMSHELRTPMNSILGFSQLMESDTADPLSPSHQENVKQVMKAGHHLLRLISEILDLARIEAGRISLTLEPVQVGVLVEEALSIIRPLADQRQISIRNNTLPFGERFVRADANRLRQILLNLLSNAVKYNRIHGLVTLDCAPGEDGRLRISVSDTGPGIPEDQQAHVFEPFHRLRADETTVEGTGIGLTIARKLITMMDGSIGFISTPGLGSCFHFELPAATGQAAAGTMTGGATSPARTASGPSDARFTVLYIEDNPANLALVAQILRRRPNIQLISAAQGTLGLELAQAHKPDLILLDIRLPDISGVEVFRRLRAGEDTKAIPVVAVSASAMPQEIQAVQEAGISKYLTKPLDIPLFLETIDTLLSRAEA